MRAPIAAGVAIIGMGIGALLGAGGGATLASKLSSKTGQMGVNLATRLGASEELGEMTGRAALALGVTAPIVVSLASGAILAQT